MKLSIKRISMFVLTLLALTFSALGITPAYAANAQKGTVDTHMLPVGSVPTVTTSTFNDNNIQQTQAHTDYQIVSLGTDNPTHRGVVYNTSGTPTTADSQVDDGSVGAVGTYTAYLNGLSIGTTYYVRAFATNSTGTAYGNEVSFTTKPGSFTVIAPGANATGVSTLPKLEWGASVGATDYEYCIEVDPSPAASICMSNGPQWVSTSGKTFINISGLATSTKYFWGVRAVVGTSTAYTYAGDTAWFFTTASTAPATTVVDVTSDTNDGTFMIGDTIDAKVKFSGIVNVTGTPQLTFETGATDRTVDYVSGSGTDTLLFNYTVQAGDTSADLNFVATSSLTPNGGTIKNAGGIDADLTLPALNSAAAFAGSNDFVIDGILPLASIDTKPASPSNSASATFTFSATDNLTVTPNFLYWCELDGAGFTQCGSSTSKTYTGLTSGLHTFDFIARDEAGNDSATVSYTWTVAVAPSFTDVPAAHWAFNFIERLRSSGITSGCGTGNYCPDSTANRAEMAVFLLKGMHGSSFTPPAINGVTNFADVATSHWAAAWIKQLAAEGITSGCGNGNYCPDNSVTRAQMAVFLLKAKHGTSYAPPAINGSTGFGDVSTTYWAAAWIKQLAAEGVTSGCGNGNFCPDNSVTRAEMAVFLVRAFGLP